MRASAEPPVLMVPVMGPAAADPIPGFATALDSLVAKVHLSFIVSSLISVGTVYALCLT